MKNIIMLSLIAGILLLTGCGGGGGSSSPTGPVVPTSYVNLNGTLNAPATLESTLLGSTLQNTDSAVRNAFASASVYVNGVAISTFIISPLPSTADWNFSLANVPESSTGKYKIEVITGRINLKSWVSDAEKSNFKINLKTTATALLSDATGLEPSVLVATYSSFISDIEKDLLSASNLTIASLTGNIVQTASVTNAINNDKLFFTNSINFVPEAQVAYLQVENDLDGDGNIDLIATQTVDGDRIKFLTPLSSSTSMLTNIASISQYTDARLLQDFKDHLTKTTRTFDANTANVALGIYMKKSASADVYLKLLIRKIDLVEGSFKGVVAEYSFVKTATTAIASGTKTIMLSGNPPTGGSVAATDFVTDTDVSPYVLTYINETDGIGCGSGNTPMVKAIDGKPELRNLSYAEQYAVGGGNYYWNTKIALSKINKLRNLEVGDVFSAYFPRTKNYALFKIKEIRADRIVVEYIINTAIDEHIF